MSLAFISIVISLCVYTKSMGQTIDIDTLEYKEICPSGMSFQMPTAGSRPLKAANRIPGKINIVTEDNWLGNLSADKKNIIESSIKSAISIWKLYLNGDSLKLELKLDNTISHDIETTVYYYAPNDTCYAYSYYMNRLNGAYAANITCDATITINDTVNWEVGYEGNGKNLTLALMQAMAHSMGFGSSLRLKEKGDDIFVEPANRRYTAFDHLIFSSNGQRLDSIPIRKGRRNNDLEAFANPQSSSVYAYQQDQKYKLYAPSTFDDHTSFCYLDNSLSLMSRQLPDDMDATIDPITMKLLDEIGWNLGVDQSLEIASNDVDSTGCATAYSSHVFYLTGNTSGLTNHSWTLRLPLANGEMQSVTTSNTQTFIIPAITNEGIYAINDNREIVGEITYTGTQGSNDVSACFMVRLQLKPHIISVDVLEKSWNELDDDYFNVTLGIRYEGCFYIYTTLEEEETCMMYDNFSYVPYYTRVEFSDIDSWGAAWITVTARNSYGNDTYFLEIACPQDYGLTRNTTNISRVQDKDISSIVIYDTKGSLVATTSGTKELSSYCKNGTMYILHVSDKNGKQRKVKYLQK